MVSQLVRSIWCDYHQQAKDEDVPGEEYQVVLDGTTTDIDLCAECAEPLAELRAYLSLYGRELKQRGRPKSVPQSERQRSQCPECGKSLADRKSVQAHMRNQHQTTLQEWLAEHTDAPKPDNSCSCGRVFSSVQGLARHQSSPAAQADPGAHQ